MLKHGAQIDKKGVKGATPLYVACEEGHTDVVALLLKRGADPEEPLNKGNTPLSVTRLKGYDDIEELLQKCLEEQDENEPYSRSRAKTKSEC